MPKRPSPKPPRKGNETNRFEDLLDQRRAQKADFIDAGTVNDQWHDRRWVVYADLIAFATRARHREVVVNNLARFHRAVTNAVEGVDVGLFRITDAVFVSCPSLQIAIAVASNLQHEALGLNTLAWLSKNHAIAHATILPRVTLGVGTLLEFAARPTGFEGVHFETFLAGDAVVAAHRIEKSTSGGLISVEESALRKELSTTQLALRGNNADRCRGAAKRWHEAFAGSAEKGGSRRLWTHDGVVDIPWLLFRPKAAADGALWTDGNASLAAKIESQRVIAELWRKEYIVDEQPVDVGKHHVALLRHVELVEQACNGHRDPQPWSVSKPKA
jgi:hypothetical protein